MTLAELREALRTALARMVRANEQIEAAGPDADVDALQTEFDDAEAEVRAFKQRISRAEAAEAAQTDLTAEEQRAAEAAAQATADETAAADAAAQARATEVVAAETRAAAQSTTGRVSVGREERTYRIDGEHTFLADIVRHRLDGDTEARERLVRNNREHEQRAQSTTAGSGGEFVVPETYLGDDYAKVLDAGRPFANAIGPRPLDPRIPEVRIPQVTGGLTAGMQTEGSAYSTGDLSTDEVTAKPEPVGHYNDLSRQSVERSDPTTQAILIEDQLRAVNVRTDIQLITGSGTPPNVRGIRSVSSRGTATYTDSSPTGAEFLKAAAVAFGVHITNHQQPSAVMMHPRRWSWLIGQTDGSDRPLVPPSAYAAVNQGGSASTPGGSLMGTAGTILGVPVIVDGNIPVNLGDGTNEDAVFVLSLEHLRFWEGPPKVRVADEVVAHNGQIRIITYRDIMFLPDRYPKAITEMSGTGLATPA